VGPAQTVAGGELEAVIRQWSAPDGIQQLNANLGDQVTLLGYTATDDGGTTTITLYWQAQREMPVSYKVFVQWVGAGGALVQDDAVPAGWQRPTTGWVPGEVVADEHLITLPASPPPGEYVLIAGMYDESTLQRLPTLDTSKAITGDHVVLERQVVR
jgi:hypothetical protein